MDTTVKLQGSAVLSLLSLRWQLYMVQYVPGRVAAKAVRKPALSGNKMSFLVWMREENIAFGLCLF